MTSTAGGRGFGRVLRGLNLKRGGAGYAGGRAVAVLAQVVLAAVATRVLDPADLGRLAAALVIGAVPGAVLGMSIRRLTVHTSPRDDLTDLKLTAVAGGGLGILAAFACGTLVIDERCGVLAALLAAWRIADSYSEIALGVWTRERRLGRAGASIAVRNVASTLVAVVLIEPAGIIAALAAGLIVRFLVSSVETAVAQPQRWTRVARAHVEHTLAVCVRISLVAVAVVCVELLATLGVAAFGGLDDAALLTPLGRVRMGFMLLAATLIEMYFSDALDAVRAKSSATRVMRGPTIQFLLISGAAGAFLVLGGAELLFGPKLEGESWLVFLAVLSGISIGLASAVGSIAMAEGRVNGQIAAFGSAAVLAFAIPAVAGWGLGAFFAGQIVAPLVAIAVLQVEGRQRRRRGEDLEHVIEEWAAARPPALERGGL